jgi:hypothetical protein
VARCRWCGGFFVKFFNQWRCERDECFAKQEAHAILKLVHADGQESPYLFLPLPLQVDLETSDVKRLLVAGAAGASKSYGARWHLYAQCRRFPGYRALLLRCSYDELYKNHLQFMSSEAASLGDAKYSGGNVRQMAFTNDSIVFMGYCDDAADIPRHLGINWDKIVFEEGVTFLPEALSEISARDSGSVTRAAVEDNCDGKTLIVTNPGGRAMPYLIDHYIKRNPDRADYPEYVPEIHGFIPATLEDNPYKAENFASQTLSGLSAARYKQLRFGDWTVFAGQFFSSFNPAKHITPLDVAAFA